MCGHWTNQKASDVTLVGLAGNKPAWCPQISGTLHLSSRCLRFLHQAEKHQRFMYLNCKAVCRVACFFKKCQEGWRSCWWTFTQETAVHVPFETRGHTSFPNCNKPAFCGTKNEMSEVDDGCVLNSLALRSCLIFLFDVQMQTSVQRVQMTATLTRSARTRRSPTTASASRATRATASSVKVSGLVHLYI